MRSLRSFPSGILRSVFYNDRATGVDLYWLDSRGTAKYKFSIPAGDLNREVRTAPHHAWRVVDSESKLVVAEFQIQSSTPWPTSVHFETCAVGARAADAAKVTGSTESKKHATSSHATKNEL